MQYKQWLSWNLECIQKTVCYAVKSWYTYNVV